MKKIIKNILFPNNVIGFLAFNLGVCLLIYVLINHLEDSPIAYISYLLSFYALVIFCIWFIRICKFSNEFLKNSQIYKLYQEHLLMILKVTMYFSFISNLLYGVFKLGIGIYYHSWWFITFAIYYLLLCFIRINLSKNLNNKEKEYHKLKHTGVILLLLNLVLIGIITLIIKQDQIINYSGVVIYLVALYDFYLIITGIINVIKYRKNKSPIIAASKCINLTVAMISMVSLEVAMVIEFGNNDYEFKLLMTSLMGFGICLINTFMSLYMIIKASKNLKK